MFLTPNATYMVNQDQLTTVSRQIFEVNNEGGGSKYIQMCEQDH